MRTVFFAVALLGLAPELHAQAVQIWTPSIAGEQAIQLSQMDVQAKTFGFMASTRIELEFHNPNNRVMEGEFVFPLTPTQTISGYALEVNGKLREGVVVPKQTARIAFEEITRRGVDPGLAELTRGNVFRTRIYPIPALGRKRVAITIEQALTQDSSTGLWQYRLPLPVSTKLERFHVRVEAMDATKSSDSPAKASAAGGHVSALNLQDAKIAERTLVNVRPEAMLSLDLPSQGAPIFAVASDADNDPYYYVTAQLKAPKLETSTPTQPKSVVIYVDASRSGLKRDQLKEQAFLRELLLGFGEAKVSVVAFRNRPESAQSFALKAGRNEALMHAIQDLDYDGGTSFHALNFGETADLAVVLTDAASSFEPFLLDNEQPAAKKYVLAVATATPDAQGVSRLARRLNATVLNLLDVNSQEAVRLALIDRVSVSATATAGACLEAATISDVSSQQAVLAWRCRAGVAIQVKWTSGASAATQTLMVPKLPTLSGGDAAPIQRLWAITQIHALELQPKPEMAQALALATRFSVVTPQTSLLVLESIEDYLRYDVMPIEPELRAEFEARREVKIADAIDAPDLRELSAEWQAFKQWHAQKHPWIEGVLERLARRNVQQWQNTSDRRAQKRALDLLERTRNLIATRASEPELKKLFSALQLEDAAFLAALPEAERQSQLRARGQAQNLASDEPYAATDDVHAESRAAPAMSGAPPPPPESPAPSPVESSVAADASASSSLSLAIPAENTLDEVVLAGRIADNKDRSEAESGAASNAEQAATLALKPYSPDAPYLARIRGAKDPYAAYLSESDADGSIGFYLDCAEYFYSEARQPMLAIRVLSNIAELQIEDVGAIRVLAEKLRQWQQWDYALAQFEIALALRSEEPQGYRDFAISLARAPRDQGGDAKRALGLLWHVASHPWDDRFASIQLTALHEFNDLLARTPQMSRADLDKLGVPKNLIGAVPVGLRVVLGWNANDVDIDLWVRDPAGEWAYYSQKQTSTGGQMSEDFTQGYGPETFTIARPLPGTYTVYAHYFANHEQKLAAPISVYLEFQTPFGRGAAKTVATVRRLDTSKEEIEIGSFAVQ